MKKKFLATMCMVLSIPMVMSGCGGGTGDDVVPDGATVLNVSVFNGGYGIKWLNAIKDAYEKINPDVYIKVTPIYENGNARTETQSGMSKTDLYFIQEFLYMSDSENVVLNKQTYPSYFADISDVWNNPAYGETEPISSKMVTQAANWFLNEKNEYRAIPWASAPISLVYNENVLNAAGVDVPVTSDELNAACETIKSKTLKNEYGKDVYPISISSTDDYSANAFYSWFAQYNGVEGWDNFWNCIDENGNEYSPTVVANKGTLRSLEAMQKMLAAGNGYLHKNYVTDSFTESQFRLLEGEAAFGFNGDWLICEMSENYTDEEVAGIKMCKFPVISSIVNTLEDTNMSDATLASIVREIDAGATSSTKCSAKDFARIKEARNITSGLSNIHMAYIPIYAAHIDEAKDFLRFMYSDQGIELYAQNTRGCVLPVKYDYSKTDIKFSNFAMSVQQIINECDVVYQYNHKHRIFAKNSLDILNSADYYAARIPAYFYATNAKDRKTPEEIYNGNLLYVATRWDSNYMRDID